MKRRQFIKTIPAIAVVPVVVVSTVRGDTLSEMKAVVADAQGRIADPPRTDLTAEFVQQYERQLRDVLARNPLLLT